MAVSVCRSAAGALRATESIPSTVEPGCNNAFGVTKTLDVRDAGEIDEFDIHVIPVFIGEGIPLVAPRHRDVPLRLRSSKKYSDGVVRLRYEVVR